jgi:hypothetical protein
MIVRDQSEIDEAVFAHIKDAAAKGDRAPSILNMSKAIHVRRDAVRTAQERLTESGRIVYRGVHKAPAWLVPETGRETARVGVGRPPISGRDTKDRNGLTPGQREVLSIARQLAGQGLEICAANIADRVGLTREGTLSRLTRIAGNGFLRPLAPGRFALVDVEKRKREAPQPVTTIRPDGVRVTVYPSMIADGALLFGSGLGRGSVAMASGGSQRRAGRPG